MSGSSFTLNLAAGSYATRWINTKTGAVTTAATTEVASAKKIAFAPPNKTTHWALVLREAKSVGVDRSSPTKEPSWRLQAGGTWLRSDVAGTLLVHDLEGRLVAKQAISANSWQALPTIGGRIAIASFAGIDGSRHVRMLQPLVR